MRSEILSMALMGSREIKEETKYRQNKEFMKTLTPDEFNAWTGKSKIRGTQLRNNKNIQVRKQTPQIVEFGYKKERWQEFEDKTWSMFHKCWKGTTNLLSTNQTIINYDGSATQQIDGLFCDRDHLFVVECKYRAINKGKPAPSSDITDEINEWAGIWKPITARLLKEKEFKDKKIVFVLATRGVRVDQKLRNALDRIDGVLLEEGRIESLTKMVTEFGPKSASTIMKQELFNNSKHRTFSKEKVTFLGSRTYVDSKIPMYHFFAKSSDLIPLCNVPRRMPSGGDLSIAYQRLLKPVKVKNIKRYLADKESFFPNSIILAAEEKIDWTANKSNEFSEIGVIGLPSIFGSLLVIDGQHRLFGTEASDADKPISVCIVEGLGKPAQASLFTTINQEQSKVSSDLMWDLYGELGTLEPPPKPGNKKEEKSAIQYIVSNIFKKINLNDSHPLYQSMKIPSHHSLGKGHTFLGFADPLCKYLKKPKNWTPGALRPKANWEGIQNFSRKRVSAFYLSLLTNLERHWNLKEPGEKWLRSNYAFASIGIVFNEMVTFLSGLPRHRKIWMSKKPEPLIKSFADDLALAILDPNLGFIRSNKTIKDAGNDTLRKSFADDLLRHMRTNFNEKYKELAPHLEEEEGLTPSVSTKSRVEKVEIDLREIIYSGYVKEYGIGWFGEIPKTVQTIIVDHLNNQKLLGKHIDKSSKEVLDQTTINDIWGLLSNGPNYFFSGNIETKSPAFNYSKGDFTKYFYEEFRMLRNHCQHHKSYPSVETRDRWMASLKYVETGVLFAQQYMNELEEE